MRNGSDRDKTGPVNIAIVSYEKHNGTARYNGPPVSKSFTIRKGCLHDISNFRDWTWMSPRESVAKCNVHISPKTQGLLFLFVHRRHILLHCLHFSLRHELTAHAPWSRQLERTKHWLRKNQLQGYVSVHIVKTNEKDRYGSNFCPCRSASRILHVTLHVHNKSVAYLQELIFFWIRLFFLLT